jgi:hypothetical protein
MNIRPLTAVLLVASGNLLACNGGEKGEARDRDNVPRVDTAVQGLSAERPAGSTVFPLEAAPYGQSIAQWAAAFWKWGLEYPFAGHPFTDDPSFVFAARQSGRVWFWAAPDEEGFSRTVTIPEGIAIFLSMLDVEASTLEDPPFYGATAADQAKIAAFYASRIGDLFLELDGSPVTSLPTSPIASPQITVDVPTPWIFGDTGGTGTSSAAGYYVMIKPLPRGTHTIHYGGIFHFQAGDFFPGSDPFDLPKDTTINLTVGGD